MMYFKHLAKRHRLITLLQLFAGFIQHTAIQNYKKCLHSESNAETFPQRNHFFIVYRPGQSNWAFEPL